MSIRPAYIRSGFGETVISKTKPFHIPFFQSVNCLETKVKIDSTIGIEQAILSKDGFFLNINASYELLIAFEKDIILKVYELAESHKEILENSIIEFVRYFCNQNEFKNISKQTKYLEAELLKALEQNGIETLNIINFSIERIGLDDYDLNNIIHFEKAKDIVTRIARVQIKDKEFIDKCRKTISHYDIVDE